MLVIGLTGNIGTGKTAVSQVLAKLGATIIDADKLGHELLEPYTQTWKEVVATFGRDILRPDDKIDRHRLGHIVFSTPKSLKKLNQIMHPRMYRVAEKRIKDLRKQGAKVVVLEAPLLIEAGWTPLVDRVWVTTAPEAVVVKRLKTYKGLDEAQILARLQSQLPQEKKARQADVVINTDCNLSELEVKVRKLWQALSKEP